MSTNNQMGLSDLSEPILYIQSDKDDHFTGALAVNAKEDETLAVLPAQSWLIHGIYLLADQNLDWRVILWRNASFDDADLDLDAYIGSVRFDAVMGFQIGGVPPFYYDPHGSLTSLGAPDYISWPFPIPYRTDTGQLHVSVQNVDSGGVAKIAGAGGEISVRFLMTPVGR